MKNISSELSIAIEASKKAESAIMKYYGRNAQIRIKKDSSPVTEADTEAEQIIIELISRHFPKHGFLSEETGALSSSSDYVWIIDPIDGTKNYIRGIPFFGTQIALLKDGIPILGVSRLPAIQEVLFGEIGCGAYMNDQQIHVSNINNVSFAHINLGGLNHFISSGNIENILNIIQTVGRVRGLGDAYAYHLLASGRCEAVIETKIKIWDIAALSIIIEEAGGKCTDFQGGKIDINTTDVICTNGLLHGQLLKYLDRRGYIV